MNRFILLFFFFSGNLLADSVTPWPFQHLNNKSGISNSAVTMIYMDREDYLWFGTWDGLNRYDGDQIKVYSPDPFTVHSINNNVIRDILEDKMGNLWVVTHDGINRYDRDLDHFERFLNDKSEPPFLEYKLKASLGPDGNVWVSLLGWGLGKYNPDVGDFEKVKVPHVPSSWLEGITEIRAQGEFLYAVGKDGRILLITEKHSQFKVLENFDSNAKILELMPFDDEMFLIIENKDGLLIQNLSDNKTVRLNISENRLTTLTQGEGFAGFWVGTEKGEVFQVHYLSGAFDVRNMTSFLPRFYEKNQRILSIKETKQGLLWVGTDGDGLYKFLTREKAFRSIPTGNPGSGELSHAVVRAIYKDSENNLYVGTRGGGINVIESGGKSTRVINTSSGLSNDAVIALQMDEHQNLWIGIDDEGIDMLESKTGKVLHFPRDFVNSSSLSFGNVYAILTDSFGNIWLGTSGYGVIKLVISKLSDGQYRLEEWDQIKYEHEKQSLKSNIVFSILEENPNILWFGTRGGGLYRYNSLTDNLENYLEGELGATGQLSNNDVLSLHLDTNENLWVGTSGGLNLFDISHKPFKITSFTQRDGLSNNTIHSILEDFQGNIWVSTNKGLSKFSWEDNTFKNFDWNDGLLNNEFSDGAGFSSFRDDELYFGGIDGLDIVLPKKIDYSTYFPALIITQFQVHNVMILPRDSTGILQKNINDTDLIRLDYDQNFISFHFTTLDFWNKHRSQFAYMLEGFDKDWNQIGTQRVVNLTNVPPGEYLLKINHTDENGNWNLDPKTIQVVITPPFWATDWAFGFYLLLLVFFQVLIILIVRARGKKKKSIAIQKLKQEQESKINSYKLQFFTNIAHEFRTPLTLINGPVIKLLKTIKEPKAQAYLKSIQKNSLRLQKLVKELIEFRKIESGNEKLIISGVDIVTITHELVESFRHLAEERHLSIQFQADPPYIQAYVDISKYEKIVLNLISNAIKYSKSGGSIHIKVSEKPDAFEMEIADTGIGIPEKSIHKIFTLFYHNDENPEGNGIGLSLTKSLVNLHGGHIWVSSKLNRGSTFTFRIPISVNKAKKLNTLVEKGSNQLNENITLELATFDQIYAEDDFSRLSVPKEPKVMSANKKHQLLLTDDNPQILAWLKDILSPLYHLLEAKDGKEAYKIIEKEKIDLLVSDVIMPEMDGYTLCKKVKDSIDTSHIPVILLTAKGEIENRIEGLEVGADAYIPKPFHPDHLLVRVKKLIESREQIKDHFKNAENIDSDPKLIHTGFGKKDDVFMQQIQDFIIKSLGNPELNAEDLAEHVAMSKTSLYKKVKALTDLTPHALIKQYRLKHAAQLLRESNLNVTEIIYETGFSSRSYFYKCFNEMYKCHPREFVVKPETEVKVQKGARKFSKRRRW